jgi:transcriptional regulator of met regulon
VWVHPRVQNYTRTRQVENLRVTQNSNLNCHP